MRTRIIAAFPGTGKTIYHQKHPDTTLDSDSSSFSWIEKDGEKVRNPDFPNNYIAHIKENIGKYEFIFVSTHREVREALLDNCVFFYLVYPFDLKRSQEKRKLFVRLPFFCEFLFLKKYIIKYLGDKNTVDLCKKVLRIQ